MSEEKKPLAFRPLGPNIGFDPRPIEDLVTSEHETVTMRFPKQVRIIHESKMIVFNIGVRQVPVELADHWYLKANGAELLNPPAEEAEEFEEVEEESEEEPTKPRRKVRRRKRRKAAEKPAEQEQSTETASVPESPKE